MVTESSSPSHVSTTRRVRDWFDALLVGCVVMGAVTVLASIPSGQHVGVTVQVALTWVLGFAGLIAIVMASVTWRRTRHIGLPLARSSVPGWLLRGMGLVALAGSMAPLNDSAHWSDGLGAAQGLLWVLAAASVVGVVLVQVRRIL